MMEFALIFMLYNILKLAPILSSGQGEICPGGGKLKNQQP